MQTKECKENFQQLEKRFNKFTDIESINKLENEYMPKI